MVMPPCFSQDKIHVSEINIIHIKFKTLYSLIQKRWKKLEFMNIKKWFFRSSWLRGWMFFLLFSSFSQHQNNILGFCFFLGHWQKYQQFFFMVKKKKQIQSLIFVTHCGYKQPVMQYSYTVLSSENTVCLIQLTSSPLILISIMIWLSHD